jgi:hypothetical protein
VAVAVLVVAARLHPVAHLHPAAVALDAAVREPARFLQFRVAELLVVAHLRRQVLDAVVRLQPVLLAELPVVVHLRQQLVDAVVRRRPARQVVRPVLVHLERSRFSRKNSVTDSTGSSRREVTTR